MSPLLSIALGCMLALMIAGAVHTCGQPSIFEMNAEVKPGAPE